MNVVVGEDNRTVEDEFELERRLLDAYDNDASLLTHLKVIAFRKVDTDLSSKTMTEWKKDI